MVYHDRKERVSIAYPLISVMIPERVSLLCQVTLYLVPIAIVRNTELKESKKYQRDYKKSWVRR